MIQALRQLIAKASVDAPDPRLLAHEINRRDRLRIRLLASLSILFWLLAAAGLVLLCVGLDRFVVYVRISQPFRVAWPNGARVDHVTEMLWGTSLIHHTIWIVAGSAVSMFLGGLCTVLLVTTSRSAMLGQINVSLRELSEQLRQLRSANPVEKIHRPGNL